MLDQPLVPGGPVPAQGRSTSGRLDFATLSALPPPQCALKATELQDHVQRNPALGFTLILQLTGVNGSQQFDKLTKTKTVETILHSMDVEGIKGYVDYLVKQAHEGMQAEKWSLYSLQARIYSLIPSLRIDDIHMHGIEARRAWVIDQLAALIRSGSIPKSDEWVLSVLNWLTIHGLFEIQKASKKSPYDAVCNRLLTKSSHWLTFLSDSYDPFPTHPFPRNFNEAVASDCSLVFQTLPDTRLLSNQVH
jgi:hypothetical protein